MQKVVLSILFNKKEADLSGGVYQRGATVPAACRSRYTTLEPQETASLGMGFVQAVLAILSSHVGKIEYGQQGRVGEVTFYSTSKRPKEFYPYRFTWDERDAQNLRYGGFENGVTYQIVVVYLITSYLDAMYRQSVSRAEVMERWDSLIYACEGAFGRNADTYGWTDFQVKAMCQRPQIRTCIAALCDALWFSMRYQVPTRDERDISITSDSVLLDLGRNVFERDLPGDDLLKPPDQRRIFPQAKAAPETAPRPGFRRQSRREQPITLDEQWLSQLRGARPKRQAQDSPDWGFPGDDDLS